MGFETDGGTEVVAKKLLFATAARVSVTNFGVSTDTLSVSFTARTELGDSWNPTVFQKVLELLDTELVKFRMGQIVLQQSKDIVSEHIRIGVGSVSEAKSASEKGRCLKPISAQ